MRNAPIVPGVPSPYALHVHPYPTRFHGPIYTRPVFGFQENKPGSTIARAQSVMTRGYNLDVDRPQPTLSGLGAVNSSWDTGQGIFKPGGYGGGVFDGDISGLGSIGARRHNSTRIGQRSVRGLGLESGVTLPAPPDDSSKFPWRTKSDSTTQLQAMVNAYLLRYKMCPIAVDGKLGGGTCGAVKYVNDKEGEDAIPTTCLQHQSEWVAPKTNIGKNCGGAVSVTPSGPVVLPQQPVLEAGMSSSTKRALGFALGGVLAIGAVVMMRKKR